MGILSSVYLNTLRTNLISKPFIISTESTVHPIEKIDFPAVALCNINRISKRAVTALALRMLLVWNKYIIFYVTLGKCSQNMLKSLQFDPRVW